MCRRTIVFGEAHSTLLACPRFQSKNSEDKGYRKDGMDTLYTLMGNDGPEGVGPSPYDKEHTNGCGREEKEERKRSYGLRFWSRACLWA
jgi:hypothetical protein